MTRSPGGHHWLHRSGRTGRPAGRLFALSKVLYEAAFGKDRQEFPALSANMTSPPNHARLLELNEIIATARHRLRARFEAGLCYCRKDGRRFGTPGGGLLSERRQAWSRTLSLRDSRGMAIANPKPHALSPNTTISCGDSKAPSLIRAPMGGEPHDASCINVHVRWRPAKGPY
jgi:hypothetical protein